MNKFLPPKIERINRATRYVLQLNPYTCAINMKYISETMYNDNPVPQAVVERKLEDFSFSNSYVFVKTYSFYIRAIISCCIHLGAIPEEMLKISILGVSYLDTITWYNMKKMPGSAQIKHRFEHLYKIMSDECHLLQDVGSFTRHQYHGCWCPGEEGVRASTPMIFTMPNRIDSVPTR